MHYGKRFPFVDLLIVTMITYGRLSLSGVVGDHPGETTIRKGRSMNIQLMNVAVDIIEQRLAPLANVLTRNNHITAMRDSFALAMPFVIVGSLLVPILFPPVSIDGASRFGQVYLLLRPILLPTFQLTIGLVALIVAFGASASLAKQYRLPERLCGLTGCLAFLLFIGFRETAVSNVYLGGMGIFTALISSTYSIEIIRFFYKKGWCIRLPDEVPLMTRNGFQLLIPLLVVMLSISVMNAILLQTTGRIVPELISEAVRPLVLASDTLMAVLISLFICNLLWFIGIHGALIITGIMNPFWMTYLFENQQALAAGSPTLPHIYLQGFWDFYLLIGGIGSTLPLVLMAMRSRSRQLKSVAKIGLLPSLFNINEPILFGFPVIMNPVFLLPFLFHILCHLIRNIVNQIILTALTFLMPLLADLVFCSFYFVTKTSGRHTVSTLSHDNDLLQSIGGSYRYLVFTADLMDRFLDILICCLSFFGVDYMDVMISDHFLCMAFYLISVKYKN